MTSEPGRTVAMSGSVTREQIGDRIAAARRLKRWDQSDLARAMFEFTGDDKWRDDNGGWDNQRISKIERGKKIVPAEQLHLFALVEGQEIAWYFEPAEPYNAAPGSALNPRYIKPPPDPVTNVIDLDAARRRRRDQGRTAHSL